MLKLYYQMNLLNGFQTDFDINAKKTHINYLIGIPITMQIQHFLDTKNPNINEYLQRYSNLLNLTKSSPYLREM